MAEQGKRRYALLLMEGTAKRKRTFTILHKGGKAALKKKAKEYKQGHPRARLRLAKFPIINLA